jgi:enamine deaminase RidA (YjgF/YER057c/UK114 family)
LLLRQFAHSAQVAGPDASVLGRVCFGACPAPSDSDSSLMLPIPLDVLDPKASVIDIWQGRQAARIERIAGAHVATDGYLLFGFLLIDEQTAGGLRAAARQAYSAIFAALDRCACIHPLRFWNYVPRINQPLDGLERYRQFNVGRQEAFLAAHRAAFVGAPAACAIGTEAEQLAIYFVAAKDAPTPVENPRQVSAYHYPAEYGPRSPTFSRATLAIGGSPTLFISGTASIVGHRSEHPGDSTAQTSETFANLRAVVAAANAKLPAPVFALEQLIYTVYVRRAADLEPVRRQFVAEVGTHCAAAHSAVFLRGDICRAELLVEIEATGTAA